jgi:hypothetical protein
MGELRFNLHSRIKKIFILLLRGIRVIKIANLTTIYRKYLDRSGSLMKILFLNFDLWNVCRY